MTNENNKKIKIAVGVSGGVDSSVAIFLLKRLGFDVIGVFMQNWDDYLNGNLNNKNNKCLSSQDFDDAKSVCDFLNIPIFKINFIKEYWDLVFKKTIEMYKKGYTPNPDIFCNVFIKFDLFQKYCLDKFKCDYIATGHYANIEYKNRKYYLLESIDKNKDQTYFLSGLNQEQLSKTIFPLGNFLKSDIRKIAEKFNIKTWSKKDSSGICFIGEQDFENFLLNYLPINSGNILDIKNNKMIGTHKGLWFYTIGQRKNLNIDKSNNKYYVCKKDMNNNILYVCDSFSSSYLYSNECVVYKFNWISDIPKNRNIEIKFRHSKNKTKGEFYILNNRDLVLKYPCKQKAVTAGQQAVLYQNNICLGGGVIFKVK